MLVVWRGCQPVIGIEKVGALASVAHIIRRRRRREARQLETRERRRAWAFAIALLLLLIVLLPGGVVAGSAVALYWDAIRGLPAPRDTLIIGPEVGLTQLYDSSGQTLLYAVEDPLGDDRQWITLDMLPPYVIDATLIAEDPDFLISPRPDIFSTAARLWMAVVDGAVASDMSLTARLARNVVVPSPANDPVRETALVAEINRRHSPAQILEWHLNTNDYGNDAYGIEAAARVYLGKSASSLTLDEAALLAAIPLAPQYNPFDNEPAARGRQQDLLRAMRRAGRITEEEFAAAINTQTRIQRGPDRLAAIAPEFAQYARDQAEEILNATGRDGARLVARGGLRIVTTLDLDLYYEVECALRGHLARLDGQNAPVSRLDGQPCSTTSAVPALPGDAAPNTGAVVVLDARTGEIRAMVGAAAATRYQPGPVLQPFVYFNAFRSTNPLAPASMVLDVPRSFPGAQEGLIYTPSNPDGRFRGPMNLRDALGAGLLVPAADVAHRQGIDNVLRDAHLIGLNSLDLGVHDLTLLERGGEVSLLDVSYAYSVFASLGNMRGVSVDAIGPGYRARDPVAVRRIEDADGNLLWEYSEEQIALSVTNVFDPALGYLINHVLSDQETRWSVLGENNTLDLPRPSAVVNGLTGDRADNWTVGYTPQLVVGVHLSREEGDAARPMSLDPFGLQGAAVVWREVMLHAHERYALPLARWPVPDNIVEMQVCDRSGLRPNGNCPVETEIFIDGRQAGVGVDTYWQAFEVNRQTGQLATASTPAELRGQQVYFVPPPEAFDWWQENNLPLPPATYDTLSRPDLLGSAVILQPEPFAYVGGVVDIRGSMNVDDLAFYQLAYGKGLNPDRWVDIGGPQSSFSPGSSLGEWDTTGLDGLYNLRLTVVRQDQTVETRVVQVTVDNQPPVISLSAGDPGRVYRWPGDTVIPLEAQVEDNLAIDRVEFYANGEYIGVDNEWPYVWVWETRGVGVETFSATAFDAVGNHASAELVVEVVRAQ